MSYFDGTKEHVISWFRWLIGLTCDWIVWYIWVPLEMWNGVGNVPILVTD